MRDIRFIQDAGRHVLVTGGCWVESYSDDELLALGRAAYACLGRGEADKAPDATGLEVTRYEAVEDTLPHITPPDDLYDEALAYRTVLAANFAIQVEARVVYGDNLTDQQCLDRVIAARWPNLPERDAYLAAAAHYEVELPPSPEQQSEAEQAGERA